MIRVLLGLILALAASPLLVAEDDSARIERLSGTEANPADWEWATRHLADRSLRSAIRTAIITRTPYPRKELLALLSHDHLAVRLGALELLEEAIGSNYGFNPWAAPQGEGSDPAKTRPMSW